MQPRLEHRALRVRVRGDCIRSPPDLLLQVRKALIDRCGVLFPLAVEAGSDLPEPRLEALRACVADAERDPKLHPVAAKRLNDMLAFVDALDRWHAQMLTVPKPKLAALIRLGTRIVGLLPLGKQK